MRGAGTRRWWASHVMSAGRSRAPLGALGGPPEHRGRVVRARCAGQDVVPDVAADLEQERGRAGVGSDAARGSRRRRSTTARWPGRSLSPRGVSSRPCAGSTRRRRSKPRGRPSRAHARGARRPRRRASPGTPRPSGAELVHGLDKLTPGHAGKTARRAWASRGLWSAPGRSRRGRSGGRVSRRPVVRPGRRTRPSMSPGSGASTASTPARPSPSMTPSGPREGHPAGDLAVALGEVVVRAVAQVDRASVDASTTGS